MHNQPHAGRKMAKGSLGPRAAISRNLCPAHFSNEVVGTQLGLTWQLPMLGGLSGPLHSFTLEHMPGRGRGQRCCDRRERVGMIMAGICRSDLAAAHASAIGASFILSLASVPSRCNKALQNTHCGFSSWVRLLRIVHSSAQEPRNPAVLLYRSMSRPFEKDFHPAWDTSQRTSLDLDARLRGRGRTWPQVLSPAPQSRGIVVTPRSVQEVGTREQSEPWPNVPIR